MYFKRHIYLPKQSIFLFLSFDQSQKQEAGKTSGLAWCYEFCTDVHKINTIFIIALIIWTFTERILTLIIKLIWILMKVSLLLCKYNLYFFNISTFQSIIKSYNVMQWVWESNEVSVLGKKITFYRSIFNFLTSWQKDLIQSTSITTDFLVGCQIYDWHEQVKHDI